jgi:hypothetical protein
MLKGSHPDMRYLYCGGRWETNPRMRNRDFQCNDRSHKTGSKGAAAQPNPPGLLSLAQRFSGNESRRGLAAAADILESIGRSLGPQRNAGH